MDETQVKKAEALVLGDNNDAGVGHRNHKRIMAMGLGIMAGMGLNPVALADTAVGYIKKPHDKFKGDGKDDDRKAAAEAKRARKAAKTAKLADQSNQSNQSKND